ncbi:hypothetical protein EP073_03585 [Geovibrio thiophilus]|uniref:ResB-like domain-containing protein n=1 Tax=Geovibrio thiophilus TaxID=139438 RepID=A0A3R5X200_9BACT|nr:cytochrome c biogenesis protein ResB [Geovibrio thiophilus]QAR32516.1 hypothetical protein EP073_03585 [Geovibrio thiophilus]
MIKKVFHAAGSLRFALFIFTVIIFVSSVGTFIRQHAPAEETTARLREAFGDAAPVVYSFLDKTGFTDLYHTYWFNFILLLLALNLIFCSVRKFPATWRKLTGKISTEKDSFSAYFVEEKEFRASSENVSKAFASVFSRWARAEGGDVLAAEKGRYGKSGAFVTHLGLVILITGGFIGGIFGYNGNIAILEGKLEHIVTAGKDKEIELPFSVYLENFESEYYENSPKQSSFRSKIHFIKDNVTTEAVVSVNSPVKFDGVTFYQSSYGVFPNRDVIFKFTVDSLISGVRSEYSMGLGQEFDIPDLNLKVKLNDFAPALGKDSDGGLVNFSTQLVNPALNFVFTNQEGESASEWILMKDPASGDFNNMHITFSDVWGAEYSVLSARIDPGLPVIYLGFIIISLGVIIAFYTSHRRVWSVVKPSGGSVSVRFFYHKDKGRVTAQREAEKMFKSLSAAIESGRGEK